MNYTIVQYDKAGYTIYENNTMHVIIARVFTQKNRHGIIIYNENVTIKQVKRIIKEYKKMNKIIK